MEFPTEDGSLARVTRRRLLGAGATVAGTASVTALGALAACTSGGGGAPAATTVKGKVIWSTRVEAAENLWQQSIVLPKMKEHFPTIELSLETAPSAEWAVKLIGAYAAGTPPDIHHGFAGIVISLYAQGQALDLTPFVKRDKFDLTPFGGLQNDPDMCRSGKYYELPVDTGLGNMLFYNAALLQEAGVPLPPTSWQDRAWTWDQALDVARKTTKRWGEPDAVYGLLGIQANPGFQIFPYVWGGDPWPKDLYAQGIAQTSQWTTPQVIEAIQFIQDLAHRHRVIPPQGAQSRPFAMGGSALWMADARGGTSALKDVTFPWGMAPLPRQVTNKTVAFTNGIMANKGAQAPEAAWQTIKYLVSQEGQSDRIKPTFAPPTRTDAFDPWLDAVQPKTVLKTKAALKEVATGSLAAYSDAWPHYVADATTLLPILTMLQTNLLSNKGSASALLADTKTQIEAQLRTTYEKLKSSPLTKDTACT
jgi:multiple sugar transport system substrate-binding protein